MVISKTTVNSSRTGGRLLYIRYLCPSILLSNKCRLKKALSYYFVLVPGNPYDTLLQNLLRRVQKQGHSVHSTQSRRTVLRVAIHRLGSPLWPYADSKLPTFMYHLRQVIHSANATAIVTLPTSLLKVFLTYHLFRIHWYYEGCVKGKFI